MKKILIKTTSGSYVIPAEVVEKDIEFWHADILKFVKVSEAFEKTSWENQHLLDWLQNCMTFEEIKPFAEKIGYSFEPPVGGEDFWEYSENFSIFEEQ